MSVRKSWAFTLDGHIFYVLGDTVDGTLLFDLTAGQWYTWKTAGQDFWNALRGTMWRGRILVADETRPIIWELDPAASYDEDNVSLQIERVVTGFQPLRGSHAVRQGALRATASVGYFEGGHLVLVETATPGVFEFAESGTPDAYLEETADGSEVFVAVEARNIQRRQAAAVSFGGVAVVSSAPIGMLRMRFSDNQGQTWSRYFDIPLRVDDDNQELKWRSLGRINAPGRLWEISDAGGVVRIDGLDADMDGEQ